jgi:hypothetical protein
MIKIKDDTFSLHELEATNPMKVNGQVLKSRILEDDDMLEFGETKLIFKRVGT